MTSAPWPGRERLIAWGLVECAHEGCRKLVNPAVAAFCKAHERAGRHFGRVR